MDIQTIINMADALVPSSVTTADKVAHLDYMQKQLHRKVDFPNQVQRIFTTADVAFYTLPSNCPADRIRHVVLVDTSGNQTELTFQQLAAGSALDEFYSVIEDTSLWIYPTPTISGGTVSEVSVTDGGSGYTSAPTVSFAGGGGAGATATASIYTDAVFLYYAPSPTAFTTADLTVSPSTPSEYHNYYLWGLCEFHAKANRDVALANNYKGDSAEVLAAMTKDFAPAPVSGFAQEVSW